MVLHASKRSRLSVTFCPFTTDSFQALHLGRTAAEEGRREQWLEPPLASSSRPRLRGSIGLATPSQPSGTLRCAQMSEMMFNERRTLNTVRSELKGPGGSKATKAT